MLSALDASCFLPDFCHHPATWMVNGPRSLFASNLTQLPHLAPSPWCPNMLIPVRTRGHAGGATGPSPTPGGPAAPGRPGHPPDPAAPLPAPRRQPRDRAVRRARARVPHHQAHAVRVFSFTQGDLCANCWIRKLECDTSSQEASCPYSLHVLFVCPGRFSWTG